MNIITKAIFILFALSVEAQQEVCNNAPVEFTYCVNNKVLTRVIKKRAVTDFTNAGHLTLDVNSDLEIAPEAFSKVNVTSLWLYFPQVNYDDKSKSKVLTLHSDSFAHLSHLHQLRVFRANVKFNGNPFVNTRQLRSLEMTAGNLTEIPREQIESLPNLDFLNLEDNLIERVPENIFRNNPHLGYINFRRNKIAKLEAGWSNGLTTVEKLDFSINSISGEPGMFAGIPWLKNLDLSEAFDSNGFHSYVLDNLPNLEVLVLGLNNLTSLEPGVFDRFPKLREISLYSNRLRNIPTGVFEKLTSLQDLSFVDNEIETIQPGAFSGLNLRFLKLENNKIKTIEPRTFSGLTVEYLDLHGNDISEVKPYAFDGLNVNSLDMTYNALREVGVDDFAGLIVKDLNLGKNPIREIADGAFSNTTLKSTLTLYMTSLERLHKSRWGVSDSAEVTMF
uniref:LRRCT domain-containing protein n=1 Tax=Bracon brevicornis TaxID=1563983 RepID=A0A6V7IPU1_9HYME